MNPLPCPSCCSSPRYEKQACSAPQAGFSCLNLIVQLPRNNFKRCVTSQTDFWKCPSPFQHQNVLLLSKPLILFSLLSILENLSNPITAKNPNFTISRRAGCACPCELCSTAAIHRLCAEFGVFALIYLSICFSTVTVCSLSPLICSATGRRMGGS